MNMFLSRPNFGWLLVVVAIAGCATTFPPSATAPLQSPPSPYGPPVTSPIRTVVIDPGHGGHDQGTAHFGLMEKALALDIGKRLRTQLQDAGLRVIMTRETDQFIQLGGRSGLANRLPADLFVSVHVNANRNRRIAGIEVYYPRHSVLSSSAPWPPRVAPDEVSLPSMTIKQVLWDTVLGKTRASSRRLAMSICRSMRAALGAPCRGIKPARFVVLREACMPAVLVEVGYVTNRSEAEQLSSAAYRQTAAQAIARGILRYARELDGENI